MYDKTSSPGSDKSQTGMFLYAYKTQLSRSSFFDLVFILDLIMAVLALTNFNFNNKVLFFANPAIILLFIFAEGYCWKNNKILIWLIIRAIFVIAILIWQLYVFFSLVTSKSSYLRSAQVQATLRFNESDFTMFFVILSIVEALKLYVYAVHASWLINMKNIL